MLPHHFAERYRRRGAQVPRGVEGGGDRPRLEQDSRKQGAIRFARGRKKEVLIPPTELSVEATNGVDSVRQTSHTRGVRV